MSRCLITYYCISYVRLRTYKCIYELAIGGGSSIFQPVM